MFKLVFKDITTLAAQNTLDVISNTDHRLTKNKACINANK